MSIKKLIQINSYQFSACNYFSSVTLQLLYLSAQPVEITVSLENYVVVELLKISTYKSMYNISIYPCANFTRKHLKKFKNFFIDTDENVYFGN